MKDLDVSTLGSTMLSLATEGGVPLLSSEAVRLDVAGAESNCAIALARLGRRVAWMSKVARTPIGERIATVIRGHGVDVSKVRWTADGRNELMWVEAGHGVNRTTVTYDRTGAAIESLSIEDVDLATIEASRFFHFSGITPALSERCRDTLVEVIGHARKCGVKISCDVNYRSKLWSAREARETMSALISGVDLLLMGQGDLRTLWDRNGATDQELRRLQDEFHIENVILTLGENGAAGLFGDAIRHHRPYPSEVVSPIGAGDAFTAGVLDSLLEGDAGGCLRQGCAMAALAREARSDYVLGGREALQAKMAPGVTGKQLSR